ncbi:hypothetical protein BSKO_08694 [Bryopsis sp. KO-2023]|nr:hypothetical protein BSKO_08694 [Bryopsis sp. KO-2023]
MSLERDTSFPRGRSFADVSSIETQGGGFSSQRSMKHMKGMDAFQQHENDVAEVILVCEPEGTSLMMGGLHPRASLYERPVNLDDSRAQHAKFREVLREQGVRVLTVREVLLYAVERHVGARVALEDLGMKALTYKLGEGLHMEHLPEEYRFYASDAYKREVLESMSAAQLIDVLLINPTVFLAPSARDTGLTATYKFQPLSNLVYTRDQQITSCKGIVMGKLRSPQRQLEVDLLRFCFDKLGMDVVGEVSGGGFLEGGDFFPAGTDLCFIGVGLRSNMEACTELMENDWLGTKRVAVVRDDFDRHQDRMHLDCVFNIVGDHCCLMLEDVIGEDSPTRRLVDEFVRDDATGQYKLTRGDLELSEFVTEEGYNIVPVKAEDQLAYGCNVLNLGNGFIIAVHLPTARQLVNSPHFDGVVQVVDFSSITSMYGAAHCSTQVLKRKPR